MKKNRVFMAALLLAPGFLTAGCGSGGNRKDENSRPAGRRSFLPGQRPCLGEMASVPKQGAVE